MKAKLFVFIIIQLIAASFWYSSAQETRIVKIGILTDLEESSTGTLLEDLKKEISGVLGSGTDVEFKPLLVSGRDFTKAQQNLQERIQDDTDVILTFGAPNTIAVYQLKSFPKPIIVFGPLSRDIIDIDSGQTTSGINNLNYIITPHSYINDLDVFQNLYDYSNIAIILDQFTLQNLPVGDIFDDYFADRPATYQLIALREDGSLDGSLDGFDAVYISGGFGLSDEQFGKLVNDINSRRLPSFSGVSRRDVERGLLASQQPQSDIQQFFRRISLNIESIVSGVNASELPMFLDYEPQLSLNFNTATLIDFPLRYSMLGTTDFVGSPGDTVLPEMSYSIIDIMNRVVDNNLLLNATEKNIELAEQDLRSAKSSFLPNLTANAIGTYIDPEVAEISGGLSPEFSTSGNLTLQQLIYSESAKAGIDIQKSVLGAEKENYNASQLDALLDASVAYFNALILKTNTRIQNRNLQLTKENLKISQQNFDAGASGKGDILRFQSQLAQNTQAVIDASNNLRQSFFLINQLVNDPISTKIDVEDAEIEAGVFKNYGYDDFFNILDDPKQREYLIEFLIQEAKTNAPELKSIKYSLEANERNYRLNNGGRFVPTVTFQGQYNLAISESGKGSTIPVGVAVPPDGTYNFGVNVSLPIFQQNQRNINRQTARIQEDQLNLQKQSIDLSIDRSINDLVLNLVREIANIEISKVSEDSARESLDLVQNEYRNGAVPVIQLIDAQNNYLEAQLARATANYNYLITSLQLERAIGYYFLMNSEASNNAFFQRANQYFLSRQ